MLIDLWVTAVTLDEYTVLLHYCVIIIWILNLYVKKEKKKLLFVSELPFDVAFYLPPCSVQLFASLSVYVHWIGNWWCLMNNWMSRIHHLFFVPSYPLDFSFFRSLSKIWKIENSNNFSVTLRPWLMLCCKR